MTPRRRGAIAVIVQDRRLLIIRRSHLVPAPRKICFPGGGIEAGESEPEAIRRELSEELGLLVEPIRRIWQSCTSWGVELYWWEAKVVGDTPPVPNIAEVAWCGWQTIDEIAAMPDLLESNHGFLRALAQGEFILEGL